MTRISRHVIGVVMLAGLLGGTTGCDWWPPSLQERIGQQEAHLKVLEAERARTQGKVAELTKAVEEVRAQSSKMEQEKVALQAQIEQLKLAVADAEAKAVKPKPVAASKRRK